ncbi:DUF2000 family protein [Hahella sp. KA22]|uniref:DUF2000 domain-containing protein n=1 Tax=Hahella sp. KA22 TaxID=1628392 RepID=UPI000FDD8FEC|nr:DUF2000 domain-containing protein [Hahella sp. KA22]AZZ92042.1 DUF2000 domain-containing protein [Hahella sp. KA22]QAY55413.1 DUF2000 family protein [Hahella sp. KA22]
MTDTETADLKCVIIIDANLPTGPIANTAAVLALSLGKNYPELIGDPLPDHNGHLRAGITTTAIPILRADGVGLRHLREELKEHEPQLTVIDLTSATMTTKSYEAYAEKLQSTPVGELEYLGIALCGPKKTVNKFTGNLGLLR